MSRGAAGQGWPPPAQVTSLHARAEERCRLHSLSAPVSRCASPPPAVRQGSLIAALPLARGVLSLPSRQPWPSPSLLPAEPHTPGTGAACRLPAGSIPRGAPQMQPWKTPAALGARALLREENKRREGQEVQSNSSWWGRLPLITANLCPFPRAVNFCAPIAISHDAAGAGWQAVTGASGWGGLGFFILTWHTGWPRSLFCSVMQGF